MPFKPADLTWSIIKENGSVILCCREPNTPAEQGHEWFVAWIYEDGTMRRCVDLDESLGLKLDEIGRIVETKREDE